jgi:hypothetical protein
MRVLMRMRTMMAILGCGSGRPPTRIEVSPYLIMHAWTLLGP